MNKKLKKSMLATNVIVSIKTVLLLIYNLFMIAGTIVLIGVTGLSMGEVQGLEGDSLVEGIAMFGSAFAINGVIIILVLVLFLLLGIVPLVFNVVVLKCGIKGYKKVYGKSNKDYEVVNKAKKMLTTSNVMNIIASVLEMILPMILLLGSIIDFELRFVVVSAICILCSTIMLVIAIFNLCQIKSKGI